MEIAEGAFRVTQDADFELSDDADDLLEAVESELRRRRFGDVVRLEVSASASSDMRERLIEGSRCAQARSTRSKGLLDQSELWQLVALDRPDLTTVVPGRAATLGARDERDATVFEEIGEATSWSSSPTTRSAPASRRSPRLPRGLDVIAIKTTVYRTSESSLIGSLIECAEEGKQSVCLVELGPVRRAAQHRVVPRDGGGESMSSTASRT